MIKGLCEICIHGDAITCTGKDLKARTFNGGVVECNQFEGEVCEDSPLIDDKKEIKSSIGINKLVFDAHKNAVDHGFWDYYNNINVGMVEVKKAFITQFLALIICETTEAIEGLRKNDNDNFKEELADIAIRLADLCGGLGVDLESEIIKKMKINADRPYKHGKEF
jgi:NTP pyrophosphatase (non-canonical NTP hydrolase)